MNKVIGSLANWDIKLGNITQTIEKGVFQAGQVLQLYLQLDSVIQAIRRTVWQAKEKDRTDKYYFWRLLYGACTVTIKHALTGRPITISHCPKKLEGFAIRNTESFTRVFKVTVWPKRTDFEVISDSYLYHSFG